jgi:sugar transferase (PEP-CTERM/EpsH1 system associated)
MQELLFLVHRIPYPPNKGDKIRSYHMVRHLAKSYRIHLGTFLDDENDWLHVDTVKGLCGETCFVKLNPLRARVRSLTGLISNSPLSLPYYRNAKMQAWVNHVLDTRRIDNIVVFSSPMAQYANRIGRPSVRRFIDFVDVDSDKWRLYAESKSWPMSWLYRRESRRLLAYERRVASQFDCSTFVSQAEASLFKQLAPETAARVSYFNNGVDADYFSPHHSFPNPYTEDAQVLVFTGAMDYWANVDAVDWFARTVFPGIRARAPQLEFYIVGARPAPQVMDLAELPGITVTGSVPDVRPFLAHATLSVAPLRIARGIQNKVLEAMAMEKTVVASPQAMEGIRATVGQELLIARDANEYVDRILALLNANSRIADIGGAARLRVLSDYSWESSLSRLDAMVRSPHPHAAGASLSADLRDHSRPKKGIAI